MATGTVLVLLMLTMAFATVDTEADTGSLQDGDVHVINSIGYRVKDGDRTHDNSEFLRNEYVYVTGTKVIDGAFRDCSNIRYIRLADSVTSIGEGAFKGCDGLMHVYGPNLVTIGDGAFRGSGVQSVTVTGNLTTIGEQAFKDCGSLTNVPLLDTSVTEIRAGTFENSSILLVDLRNIETVDPDAFVSSDLRVQVVRSDQGRLVLGVDRIVCDDTGRYDSFSMTGDTVRVTMPSPTFFTVTSGSVGVDVSFDYNGSFDYTGEFSPPGGEDCTVECYAATVSFPDDIGMAETLVTLEPGATTYTMPEGPDVGDLRFLHWEVEGLSGEVTALDRYDLVQLEGRVEAVPVYGNAVLTMDHSGIADMEDVSGLDEAIYFTYGDTYPVPDDLEGHLFAGWSVDGTVVAGGERIGTYVDHTIASLWEPKVKYALRYTESDGTVISSEMVGSGYTAHVSPEIVAREEIHQRFAGWSLDGSTVLDADSGILMDSEKTLVPVFETRAVVTVTYTAEGTSVSTGGCYEGRTFTADFEADDTDTKIFLGWTLPDGTPLEVGGSFTADEDTVLTAQYRDRLTYAVEYMDGAGGTLSEEVMTEGLEYTVPLYVPERDGWFFVRWTGSDGMDYAPGDSFVPEGAMVMTAQWREPYVFDVVYDDGTHTRGDTATEGVPYVVDDTVPTMDGRFFVQWMLGDTPVDPGERIEVTAPITLNAQWREPYVFEVAYSGTDMTEETVEGVPYMVSTMVPETEGLFFVQWMMGETPVHPGEEIEVLSDVTLTPEWREPYTYDVTYDRLGLTEMATEGVPYTVNPAVPETEGKVFVHWTSGDLAVEPGDVLEVDGDVVLTAQWRDPYVFTVTYDTGYGTFMDTATEGTPYMVSPDVPERDGLFFLQWLVGGIPVQPGEEIEVSSDMTVTAQWREPGTYVVTYDLGGSYVKETATEGVPYTVTSGVPEGDGRFFTGWTLDGTPLEAGQTLDVTGDVTITAQWRDPFVYDVVYVDGGSEIGHCEAVEGEAFTVMGSLGTVTGKEFSGWRGPDGTVHEPGDRVTVGSDTMFTAVWTDLDEHIVTFVSMGKVVDVRSVYESSSVSADADPGQRYGYVLAGWSVEDDGTADYDVGERFVPGGNVTLHAVWERIHVTVPEGPDDDRDDPVVPDPPEPEPDGDDGDGTGDGTGSQEPDVPGTSDDAPSDGPEPPDGDVPDDTGQGADSETPSETGDPDTGDDAPDGNAPSVPETPSGDGSPETPGTPDDSDPAGPGSDGDTGTTVQDIPEDDGGSGPVTTGTMLAVTAVTIAAVTAAMFIILRRS